MSFDLPLSEPILIENTTASLRLYDPIYYYTYSILPEPGSTGLPEGCQIQIVPFQPDAAANALQEQLAALSREDTPTQENVGRLFADEVSLTCG